MYSIDKLQRMAQVRPAGREWGRKGKERNKELPAILGTFRKRGRQRQHREARKRFLSNPYILLSISLLWLLYVSIFDEIPMTPASPPERNDGR